MGLAELVTGAGASKEPHEPKANEEQLKRQVIVRPRRTCLTLESRNQTDKHKADCVMPNILQDYSTLVFDL